VSQGFAPPPPEPRFLVETRGVSQELGAFAVAACFDRAGKLAAFALGDGTLRLIDAAAPGEWRSIAVHDGAVLSLCPDHARGRFLTGGDDGAFRRTDADGTVSTIDTFGMKWVENVACHAGEKGGDKSVLACSVGKLVHVYGGDGTKRKTLEHPSTVTGLVFDAKGKRIAASHYNGATLWFVAAKVDSPRRLEWKGSHTGIAIHPSGEALVTAMQENALHGWRLSDGQHMRMSGYPSKTESMGFTRGGKWLATSGADAVVLWPFFGGGPMGKAPTELAGGDGVVCTRVAPHPDGDMIAAGFADGLVVLADIGSSRILPVVPHGHGPVTALAWDSTGTKLAVGTETGYAAIVDFAKRA
jgi:WD40 repeat protein